MRGKVGMKKYAVSIICLFQLLLLSLGVEIFSLAEVDGHSGLTASSQVVASSIELKSTKPNNLSELQNASEAQLEAWANLQSFDSRDYNLVTGVDNQGGSALYWVYLWHFGRNVNYHLARFVV